MDFKEKEAIPFLIKETKEIKNSEGKTEYVLLKLDGTNKDYLGGATNVIIKDYTIKIRD